MGLPRLVYVSGPISKGDQFRNVQSGIDAYNDLMDEGIDAYCPHWTLFAHMTRPRTHDQWMRHDLDVILPRCNAVLRLPGESIGADMEVQRARELGIPVFESLAGLRRWWKE
jgi:hypothetical protein